jgi:DNA mismatch repair protein MutS2
LLSSTNNNMLLPLVTNWPYGVATLPAELQPDAITSLTLLEWDAVLPLWCSHIRTPEGLQLLRQTPFFTNIVAMQQAQLVVEVFKSIVQRFGSPILPNTVHQTAILPLTLALAKGAVLSLKDAVLLLNGLQTFRSFQQHALKYLKSAKETVAFHAHSTEVEEVTFDWLHQTPDCLPALQVLLSVITPEGTIREQASPTLATLMQKLKHQQATLQATLQQLLKNATVLKALQEPIFTQRNGRYVLPVNVFYKTSVPGIVQDVSSSGNTLFIEPKPIVELSNRISATESAIEAEIAQVLKQLSAALEPSAPELISFVEMGTWCDRYFAAAQLSKQLDGNPVRLLQESTIATQPAVMLNMCKHPLLVQQLGDTNVVGNTIALEKSTSQTLIITGPNTGGKTVLLKSLGLSILMLQAGLHPCVAEGSRCCVLAPVLADIGDAQNLAQNLSTFSGQMKRLSRFVGAGSQLKNALLLIDEITAGTDPLEGTALARAIIRQLHASGAFTVVTTHLGVLKTEAHNQQGYANASVAFDLDNLQPTYRLLMGVPGASNALNIAERLGLPASIVQEARSLLEGTALDSASLLTELETRTVQATEAHETVKALEQELAERLRQAKQEQQDFRERKKKLWEQYQLQFKARIRGLEEQAKRLKKQLHKAEQEPEKARYLPTQLKRLESQVVALVDEVVTPITEEIEAQAEVILQEQKPVFTVGMRVRCSVLEGIAVIDAITADGKKITLKSGHLKVVVKPSQCQLEASVSTQAVQALKKAEHRTIIKRLAATAMEAKASASRYPQGRYETECDVRGMRAEAAKEAIEAFLDNAHMMGFDTVGIIHGQGTGVLKAVVKAYLKESAVVRSFYPEQAHLGGDGKTIVELK